MLTTSLLTLRHTRSQINLPSPKDYYQKTKKFGEFHLWQHRLMMKPRYWCCLRLNLKDRSRYKKPSMNLTVLTSWETMLLKLRIISQCKSTKLNDTKIRLNKRSMMTKSEKESNSLENLSDLELTSLLVLQAWHSSTYLSTEDFCILSQLLIQ